MRQNHHCQPPAPWREPVFVWSTVIWAVILGGVFTALVMAVWWVRGG